MAADPAELRDLQTVVLDLEELRRLLRAAERPGVQSVLSRAISRLASKIISDSTTAESDESDEEAYQEDEEDVNLAETSSKKKRKGRSQPENSMMTKKLKPSAIKRLPVVNGSSSESMEEELCQQQTQSLEQVLQENVNISDVNEASHMAVLSTKNSDISNKKSQMKKSWCRLCEKPNHAESECCRLNGTCFNCHEIGHIVKNCPKLPRGAKNASRMRIVTAGSSCESIQEELSQQLPTEPSDQVSGKKASSGDVKGESILTIVATENTGVSNETSQTMPSPATTVASEFKNCPSGKRKSLHTCHFTHDKSECLCCNSTCSKCHETGHLMANCPKIPQYTNSSCGNITVTTGTSCKSTQVEPNQESLPTGVSEKTLPDKATSSNLSKVRTMAVVGTEIADVSKGKPNLCTIVEPTAIIQSSSQTKQEEQNQQPIPAGTSKTSRKRSWCRKCQKSNHTESECCRLNGTCFTCHEAGHMKKNCPKATREIISISDDEETVLATVENSDVSNEISLAIPQVTALSGSTLGTWCGRCQSSNHAEPECAHLKGTCLTCHEMGHFTANCPKKKGTAFSGLTLGTPKKNKWCGRCKLSNHAESECARLNGACLTCHEMGHFTANCPKKKAQDVLNHSGVKTSSVTKAKVKGKVPADAECFYCNHKGHWKRSCPKYLADLESGKVLIPSDKGS